MYLVSVLLRLARFNTSKNNDFFIGLPCPVGAILISLSFIVLSKINFNVLEYKEISVFFTLLISFLMISKFSYFSFKNIGDREKIKFYWLFFTILALVITLINPPMVLLLLAIAYSLSGLFINVMRQFRRKSNLIKENNEDKYV